MYYGEVNIYQENLGNFLNIAEELDLKGLNEGQFEFEEEKGEDKTTPNHQKKTTLINGTLKLGTVL